MFKVFLVEDESVIREGLKNNIPWEECGYELVGEASDGEMALPMIRELRPDLLITDIKMPFMDGLTLSRLVMSELPGTKIVIISGYDEFEYARQAIQIGIERYLLKPIPRKDMKHVLAELKEKLMQERAEQDDNLDVDPRQLRPEVLREFLDRGTADAIPDFVHSYMQSVGDAVESRIFRSYLVLNIRFTAISYVESLGTSQEEYFSMLSNPEWDMKMGASEVEPYFMDMVETAIALRSQKGDYQSGKVLRHALDYIDENFDKESLTLNSVAEAVNVSGNYLSTIFSQSMQKTFTEYVTGKRMEKAKTLLRSTDAPASEIAQAVGYNDAHYFGLVFKKTQGCSPREYRTLK